MLKRTKAQSLGEYVIVLSLVSAVAISMFPKAKRGLQSMIKVGTDQIAGQKNAEQNFSPDSGYTDSMNSLSNSDAQTTTWEYDGSRSVSTFEETNTVTNSLTNMGFTKEE